MSHAGDPSYEALLDRAEEALVGDDLVSARHAFEEILRVAPNDLIAHRGLAEIERLTPPEEKDPLADVTIRLTLPIERLMKERVSPPAAFVLSRFAAGPLSFGALCDLCPMPRSQVREIVIDFLGRKLLTSV